MRHKVLLGVLALLLLAPVQARAAEVFTMHPMDLRAGPKHDYPLLMIVPAKAKLRLFGCLKKYDWCDVASGKLRGWIRGNHIAVTQHGRNIRIQPNAEALGVPVLAFNQNTYWGRYYPDRNFHVSKRVQQTDWRKGTNRRCYDPGRNSGDCHLMVVNHDRPATSSAPSTRSSVSYSAAARREADNDHTYRPAYTGPAGPGPGLLRGYATYDKSAARYND